LLKNSPFSENYKVKSI